MPLMTPLSSKHAHAASPSASRATTKYQALLLAHSRDRSGANARASRLQLQLCDETRAQYEQMLERQEQHYEEQLQAVQRRLEDVVRSHVSLAEHETILLAAGERFRDARARQGAAHTHELKRLDTTWRSQWQEREAALLARCEDEKRVVLDMLPPLELERNDALRRLKEQEIDQLTWHTALDDETRARERAEARLREACKHILTLKACVKKLEQRLDAVADEYKRAATVHDRWQQAKLQLAETTCAMEMRIAVLEQELQRAQETLSAECEHVTALQSETQALRAQHAESETALAAMRASEQAASERRDAERAQFTKELDVLQQALAARRSKLKDARARATVSEQRVVDASIRNQKLTTKLAMLSQRQSERERKWRKQKAALQTRVAQLASVARKLQTQQDERMHDAQLSQLLFGGDVQVEGNDDEW